MKECFLYHLLIILLLLSPVASASLHDRFSDRDKPTEPKPVSQVEIPTLPTDNDNNIEVGLFGVLESPLYKTVIEPDYKNINTGEFQFRLSVGYGQVTNPLWARDDISAYVLPEFSYYSDKFYIENFVLGYSLFESQNLILDVYGYINTDGYFFELDGIENLTIASILDLRYNPRQQQTLVERHLSYMSGLNAMYRINNFDLRMSYATDISGVHNGQETIFEVSKLFVWENLHFKIAADKTLKSDKINQYYYHSHADEPPFEIDESDIGATDSNSLALQFGYKFSAHWSFNALVKKTWLDDKLEKSIFVKELDYLTTFVGIGYQF